MPEPASIPAVPPASGSPRTWRRPPLIADRRLRWLLILGALGYLTLAIASLDLDWARIGEGWLAGSDS